MIVLSFFVTNVNKMKTSLNYMQENFWIEEHPFCAAVQLACVPQVR